MDDMEKFRAIFNEMNMQVSISPRDSRKLFRKAVAANVTAYLLLAVGNLYAKKFIQSDMGKELINTAKESK